MKKVLLWFWLLTKRQLKSVFFLILLILIPLLSWIVSGMDSLKEEQVNRVALFTRDEDEISMAAVSDLLSGSDCYEFHVCGSEEELMEEVRTGKSECGYIFNDKISERIEKEKYKECIIIVRKENSILADAVSETVFASFFKEFCRKTAIDYVKNNEKFAGMDPEGLIQLEGTFENYLIGNGTFKVEFEMLGEESSFAKTQIIETQAMSFPLRNVMAVLIMAGSMLGVLNWLLDREMGVFAPMRHDFICLSRPLYVFIPSALLGISTIFSMIAIGENSSILHEILAMLFYVILLTIVGTFCCYFLKKSFTVISAMPVLIIASLLVCPVFIDLSLYLPVIGILRKIFVPYYYMISF